jgi:hypothetical protein
VSAGNANTGRTDDLSSTEVTIGYRPQPFITNREEGPHEPCPGVTVPGPRALLPRPA